MTYRGVLKYLFDDHIVPQMRNRITGEWKFYWECMEDWNFSAMADVMDKSIAYSEIVDSLDKGTYKPNKKKDKLMWDTGWYFIDKESWALERFEINE